MFNSENELNNYLETVDGKYSKNELINHLECLYRGFGKIVDPVLTEMGIKLPDNQNRRWILNRLLQD